MTYECQSCYTKFEDNEIGKNFLGDLQCSVCGGFEVDRLDDPNLRDDGPPEFFYGENGLIEN